VIAGFIVLTDCLCLQGKQQGWERTYTKAIGRICVFWFNFDRLLVLQVTWYLGMEMTPGGAPDTTPLKLVPNPAPPGAGSNRSSAADDPADALQVQVVRLTPLTTANYQMGMSFSQTVTINSATVQLRAATGTDPPLPTPM
jgi:hypothetical protein